MIQRGSNAPVMFAETTQASDDPMHEINLGDTGQIKLATEQVGVALGPQESPLDFTLCVPVSWNNLPFDVEGHVQPLSKSRFTVRGECVCPQSYCSLVYAEYTFA